MGHFSHKNKGFTNYSDMVNNFLISLWRLCSFSLTTAERKGRRKMEKREDAEKEKTDPATW